MNEMLDKVLPLLQSFATSLGVTVARLMEILTVRARIEGGLQTVLGYMAGMAGIVVFICMFRNPVYDGPGDLSESTVAKRAVGCGALIIAVLAFSYATTTGLVQYLTPEATAVQQLLEILR